jgi:DNA polymerase-4
MFVHIDIDSFFISAERTKNPKLLGIPAAVGSRSNLEIFSKNRENIKLLNINSGAFVTPVFHNDFQRTFENYFIDKIDGKDKIRGIITTASYEARACGVKTAMPIAHAISLCPQIVVVPSNYTLYHKLSRAIYIYLKKEIPLIEQYSIDEFFGKLDGWIADDKALEFATKLKDSIYKKFKIPVSIGIAESKFIAKVATNYAKPYGVHLVKEQQEFIKDIPIEKFPGIGKSLSKRLHSYGIKSLSDICNSKELLYRWKLPGIELYNKICGYGGDIKIKEPKKSIGLGRTFDTIYDYKEIKRRTTIMARHIAYMVSKADVNPLRYELKINYSDGSKSKEAISTNRLFSEHLLKESLLTILKKIYDSNKGVIKLRVSVYNFQKGNKTTLSLLEHTEDIKQIELDSAVTNLRNRFGLDILKNANEI